MSDNPYIAPSDCKNEISPGRPTVDLQSLVIPSAMIGVVFAVLAGVIGVIAYIVGNADWQMLALPPPMTGCFAFVASLILGVRDQLGAQRAYQRLQQRLMIRGDLSFDLFAAELPQHETGILSAIREAVASYLQVPSVKIYPDDRFESDYGDPMAGHFVLMASLESLKLTPPANDQSQYSTSSIADVAEIIEGFQQQIDLHGQ